MTFLVVLCVAKTAKPIFKAQDWSNSMEQCVYSSVCSHFTSLQAYLATSTISFLTHSSTSWRCWWRDCSSCSTEVMTLLEWHLMATAMSVWRGRVWARQGMHSGIFGSSSSWTSNLNLLVTFQWSISSAGWWRSGGRWLPSTRPFSVSWTLWGVRKHCAKLLDYSRAQLFFS